MSFGSLMGQTYPEFPIGGICLWSGSQDSIPDNWILCDGNNGTPDLRDRFVIGSGSRYQAGAVGGEETHVLSVDEMPKHSHIYGGNTGGTTSPPFHAFKTMQTGGYGSYPHTEINTLSTGNSQPHNNLPPYYALCYIMKVA